MIYQLTQADHAEQKKKDLLRKYEITQDVLRPEVYESVAACLVRELLHHEARPLVLHRFDHNPSGRHNYKMGRGHVPAGCARG